MIELGYTNPNYREEKKKDTAQDIKLESLQGAVDVINGQILALQGTVSALENSITDRYSAQTQTLLNALNSQISSLSLSLSTSFSTNQINVVNGSFERLAVTVSSEIAQLTTSIFNVLNKANVNNAEIDTATISQAQINDINAQNANIYSATISLLEVAELTVSNMRLHDLEADNLSAENAQITDGNFEKIKTKVLTGKEWRTPISAPDNTELLHISIQKYKGVVQIQTQDNEFNLTIFNDSSVTLNQSSVYIYRVERNLNTIDVYLQNVGDTINYRILYIGSEIHGEDFSEIVDRTLYEQNITQVQEVVFFDPQDKIIKSQQLGYLVGLTASVQEQLNSKQPKILETPVQVVGQEFFSVETLLEELANVFNSMVTEDIIYKPYGEALLFPYNSIQYDSETETITIIGFRIEYIDGTLWITKAP